MSYATHPAYPHRADPAVEIRFTVDTEPPLAYARDDSLVDVELAGPAGWAALTVPLAGAREWAGELYAAVSVAYREATGDLHALTDDELSALGNPEAYDGCAGVLVRSGADRPATVRFQLVVDIAGDSLSTADLREALVAHVADRFNTARIAVSAGEVLAGIMWPPTEPK
jgi:hypothetical protein